MSRARGQRGRLSGPLWAAALLVSVFLVVVGCEVGPIRTERALAQLASPERAEAEAALEALTRVDLAEAAAVWDAQWDAPEEVRARIGEWRRRYLARLGLGPEHWDDLIALSKGLLKFPRRVEVFRRLTSSPGLTEVGREQLLVALARDLPAVNAGQMERGIRVSPEPGTVSQYVVPVTRGPLSERALRAVETLLLWALEQHGLELDAHPNLSNPSLSFDPPGVDYLLLLVMTDPRASPGTVARLVELEAEGGRLTRWLSQAGGAREATVAALAFAFSPRVSEEQFDRVLRAHIRRLKGLREVERGTGASYERVVLVRDVFPVLLLGPRLTPERTEAVLEAMAEVKDPFLQVRSARGPWEPAKVMAGFASRVGFGRWLAWWREHPEARPQPMAALPMGLNLALVEKGPEGEPRFRERIPVNLLANRFTFIRRADLGLLVAVAPYRFVVEHRDPPAYRYYALYGFLGGRATFLELVPYQVGTWAVWGARPGESAPALVYRFVEPVLSEADFARADARGRGRAAEAWRRWFGVKEGQGAPGQGSAGEGER